MFLSNKACFGGYGARSDPRASFRATELSRGLCLQYFSSFCDPCWITWGSQQPHRWFLRGASSTPSSSFPCSSPCCWDLWRMALLLPNLPVRKELKWGDVIPLGWLDHPIGVALALPTPETADGRQRTTLIRAAIGLMETSNRSLRCSGPFFLPPPHWVGCAVIYFT